MTTIAIAIIARAITIRRAIKKEAKNLYQNEAKKEKRYKLKKTQFEGTKIISNFGCINIIFADYRYHPRVLDKIDNESDSLRVKI